MNATTEAGISLLGVVENMSGCVCSQCDAVNTLFPGSAGKDLAATFEIPLLASIPFQTGEASLPAENVHVQTLIDNTIEALE